METPNSDEHFEKSLDQKKGREKPKAAEMNEILDVPV